MLLPNKLFSYGTTALPLLPRVLRLLDEPAPLIEIAEQLRPVDPVRLIDALDCLYALGSISLDDEGVLHRC